MHSCNDTRRDRRWHWKKKTVSFYKDPILTSKIQGMRFKYYTCWINSHRMGGLNWRPRMNSGNGRRRDMRGHCTKKKIGSFYKDPILTCKIQGMRFKYYTCWINSPRMGGLNWWPRMNSCNGRRRDMRGHCTKKKIGSFYKDAMLTSKFQGICSKYFTWRINRPRIGGLTWRLWMHSCNDIDRDIRGHCKKIKRGNMQSAFIKITSQQGRFKGYVKKFYTCRINRPRGLSWGLWMYSSIFLFSILFSINHTKR